MDSRLLTVAEKAFLSHVTLDNLPITGLGLGADYCLQSITIRFLASRWQPQNPVESVIFIRQYVVEGLLVLLPDFQIVS